MHVTVRRRGGPLINMSRTPRDMVFKRGHVELLRTPFCVVKLMDDLVWRAAVAYVGPLFHGCCGDGATLQLTCSKAPAGCQSVAAAAAPRRPTALRQLLQHYCLEARTVSRSLADNSAATE